MKELRFRVAQLWNTEMSSYCKQVEAMWWGPDGERYCRRVVVNGDREKEAAEELAKIVMEECPNLEWLVPMSLDVPGVEVGEVTVVKALEEGRL